jgi:tetratricopeptide (TPR) repeat protein
MRLEEAKRYEEQIALATAEIPKLAPGTSLSNVLQNAINASWSAPKGSASRAKLAGFIAQARKVVADESQPMLADDRSSLYEHIVEALHDDDPKLSKEIAREWAAYLEAQAAKATTPQARAVFDSHRLSAYIALGEPQKAIPMLEQSAHDAPGDSNPPTRLARAYLELKRYDRALSEVDRALSLAYGPRKLQVYMLKADIQAARGDRAGERATLTEASKAAHASSDLPRRYVKMASAIDTRLAALKP